MSRLTGRFEAVLRRASRTLPWLEPVVPVWCPRADREHAASWRQFSHAGHRPGAVCWARAAERELTDAELDGISAHELGHLVGDEIGAPAHRASRRRGKGDEATEREANLLALVMGFRVRYNARTLEELA